MNKKFDFEKYISKLKQSKNQIPDLVGGIALKHFQRSFRDGGFTDSVLNPWVARKTKNRSDRNNPTKNRALLVDSGVLKNSGRVRSATFKRVVVGFYGTEYGTYHNQGEGHNPKRQFIGDSAMLRKKVSDAINKQIKTIFK